MTTRPQLASSPAIAVFTSGELAIDSATRCALASDTAPSTVDGDELGRALAVAHDEMGELRAQIGQRRLERVGAGIVERSASGALPAAPVAKASTVSEVEVSLSTVMQEKLRAVGLGQHRLEEGRLDRGIGEDEAEHRRHVRRDHARSLDDADQRRPSRPPTIARGDGAPWRRCRSS